MKRIKWQIFLLIFINSCSEEEINLTCRVKWKEIELSAPFPSEITGIFVQEGERVKEKQSLLSLDIREMEIQLEGIEKGIAAQNHRIKSLEIAMSQLKKNLERAKSLKEVGGTSSYNVEELETKLRSTEEELKSLKNAVEAEEKKAELLKVQMEKAVLKSPSEGIVDRVFVEKGERVLPNTLLIKISAPSLHAICYVSHSLMSKLKIGQKVILKGQSWKSTGSVSFISSEPEFTPRYYISDKERDILHYMVKIQIDGEGFKNGEFVRVIFENEK
jgi:HlyD family secretion protein